MSLNREFRHGRNLVFVGGAPRTGTTLVQNILDSHPDITGGAEFDRIPDIVDVRNKLIYSVKVGRISDYVTIEDIDREIRYLIEHLLLPYMIKKKASLLSEKTPLNVFAFRGLLEIFSQCHCIFCVRDPRDVAASMLAVGRRAQEKSVTSPRYTKSIEDSINMIKACNKAGFAVAGHPRLLVVVHEELVRDPERQTRRLCEYLNVPWHEEMMYPDRMKHDGDRFVDDVWYDMAMYYRSINKDNTNNAGNQLTSGQSAMLNDAFRDDADLKKLGYSFP